MIPLMPKAVSRLGPGEAERFPAADHDHESCVATAINDAVRLCASRNVRLTGLRQRVLELVWASHAPVGAYQLLERLATERGRVAPPTIYRALEFLTEHGLIHRIDTLNAFVGCNRASEGHKAYFLICSRCGAALEFHDAELAHAIRHRAQASSFLVQSETVEISGLCATCSAVSECA
jgi:Fur family zinc uptake transcriptional regulator